MFIKTQLEIWAADRAYVRIDDRNPICPGCDRREQSSMLDHCVNGQMVCAECADDDLEKRTGSRWG